MTKAIIDPLWSDPCVARLLSDCYPEIWAEIRARAGDQTVTIDQIADAIDRGEAVSIPASYWGQLMEDVQKLNRSVAWHVRVKDGVVTLTRSED